MPNPNSPTKTYVSINGIDVTSYVLEWSMEEEWGNVISELTLILRKSIDAVIDISEETPHYEVIVKRGPTTGSEYTVFEGFFVDHKLAPGRYLVVCMDKYFEAIQREANTSFDINIDPEAGVISEIFKTLIQTYTTLTVDSTSVQNSGTTFVRRKFVANHAKVFERTSDLADTLNWQHYYDSRTSKLYFEPKGYTEAATVLTVGDNVINVPIWDYNKRKMFNKLTIIGAEREAETTEFFSGDGSTTDFTLSYTPTSMKVYVGATNFDPFGTGTRPSDTPGNLEVGGREDSTSGTFNYEYDDDPRVKKVIFQSGSIPSNNTSNIEIQYTYKLPAPVLVKNITSIDTYGIIEETIVKDDIKNVADAEVYGRSQLGKYSLPFLSSTLLLNGVEDVRVGRVYEVIHSSANINRFLIVSHILRKYPYRPDEITVGDEILKTEDFDIDVLDRIKRLEEKDGRTSDLLVQVLDYDRTFIHKRRYSYLEKKSLANTFVLGSAAAGIIGTNILGANPNVFVTAQIQQGNNNYEEYLYDDTFIDTANSTATLDTSNRRIHS